MEDKKMKFKKQSNVPFFSKYTREDGKYTITSEDRKINGIWKNVFEVTDEKGNLIDVLPRLKDAKEKYSGENEEKKEIEDKTMTVRGMRAEAKEMGIKGYSRMSKEDLQKAIATAKSVEKFTESLETEEVEVVLKAFTGMVIGTYTAVYGNGTYTLATKNGYLKFDESGKQLDAKNPKFANKIEKLTPDHFESGETIKARGGSIFTVTTLTKEVMNKLGYFFLFNSDDRKFEIFGNGTRAFAIAK